MNQQVEVLFYHYIMSNPDLAISIEPKYFKSANIRELYAVGKEFCIKYRTEPTASQMKELISIHKKDDVISEDIIDIIYAQKNRLDQYTTEWLDDNTKAWAEWSSTGNGIVDAAEYYQIRNADISPENVKESIEYIRGTLNRACAMEFDRCDDGCDFFDADSHKESKLKRTPTGIPYIDQCLNGGTWPGSLIAFAGAPKVGKSMWLQNICATSIKKGRNCIYISLELPQEMITQRIGANLLNIPSLEYSKYAADENFIKEKLQSLARNNPNPLGTLRIKSFPTSTLTSIELESYILKMEEKLSTENYAFKFDHVYLDYINIMKNYRNPNSENTYQKIKALAEDVRAIAVKNNWCILTATQTTRDQADSTDMVAAQVSESSGFGATVDALFGILATPIDKAQGHYNLKCILDRVCPMDNTRKRFLLDKTYLRITEDPDSFVEDAEAISMDNRRQIKNTMKSNGLGKYVQEDESKQSTMPQPQIGNTYTMSFPGVAPNITGTGLF